MKYKAAVSSWRLPGHWAVPVMERKPKLRSFSLSQQAGGWADTGTAASGHIHTHKENPPHKPWGPEPDTHRLQVRV